MPVTITKSDDEAVIANAVERLAEGKLVAIPTETVYGLAGDATNGNAVASIFAMKGRPSFNPLICHVDGIEMAERYGAFSDVSLKLAKAFWPGPLTIVVAEKSGAQENGMIHDLVTANLGSIGIRCPKGIARDIIRAFGRPLAAPSANRSGKISPTSASHVSSEFPDSDLLIVDSGACEVGLESTIVKVEDGRLTLLRSGAIGIDALESIASMQVYTALENSGIQAPGMMESHYAPDATVFLNCSSCPAGCAWLGFGDRLNHAGSNAIASMNLSEEGNMIEAAANLYAFLKALDGSGAKSICVAPIPETGLGIAINDRLRRAAAPRHARAGKQEHQ